MTELGVLLACQSFFSEGRSTVSPKRLVRLARAAGFTGLGLVDWCSVAGAVELHQAARAAGLRAVTGVTLPVRFPANRKGDAGTVDAGTVDAGEVFPLVLLARSRPGYAALCELLTRLHLDGLDALPLESLSLESRSLESLSLESLSLESLPGAGELVCLTGGRAGFPSLLGERREMARAAAYLRALRALFPFSLYLQLDHGCAPNDGRRMEYLRGLARDLELPVVSAPFVQMGTPQEYALLDALCCARLGVDVQCPHPQRPRNDARHVGTPGGWGQRLPCPDGSLNAQKLALECAFELLPEHLNAPLPPLKEGQCPQDALEERVWRELPRLYAGRPEAEARLRAELDTVRSLDMAAFFLTAAEVTDYCRSHGILAAGRGSAAGSVLCYLLGITLSEPLRHGLLFERFLHTGRSSMPDVDIDIASSRRAQVLRWVEERFGAGAGGGSSNGEAMVANRVTYRLPGAVQDLGRALGLPPELRDRLSRALGRDYRHLRPHRAREAALVFTEVLGEAPVKEALLALLERVEPGFVRHLAPHSGGVVLGRDSLTHFSPLSRSSGGIRLLSFDKEDVEALGLIKLDLLGLRMLGALERAREETLRLTGEWVPYGDLPDDPALWDELARGDTMSLFQVESPAQTQLAPRLKPRNMTELAHQIALVRPGPIQSGTVHPYVRRARGEEGVPDRPEPVKSILAVTHGTLMFQEQILRLAVHYAGFTWAGADRFRSRLGKVEDEAERAELRESFVSGAALTCGAFPDEAGEVFELCAAFRGFGFAESHAHAFAQHTYASLWMRRHHPAAFLAGVLTEAPGMWPAQTVSQEFRRRGVRLLPLCINLSGLSYRAETLRTVREPLTGVAGLGADSARMIVQERLMGGKFTGLEDCFDRVALNKSALESLVQAGAFDGFGPRREVFYTLQTLLHARPPGRRGLLCPVTPAPELPELSADDLVTLDLHTKGVTATGRHPLDAHRARLRDLGCAPLGGLRHGQQVWTAGLIVARQRPPTARGFAFYVLEDAGGRAQTVISPDLWEAHRVLLRDARALIVQGEVSRLGHSVTVKVQRLAELPLGQRAGPLPSLEAVPWGGA